MSEVRSPLQQYMRKYCQAKKGLTAVVGSKVYPGKEDRRLLYVPTGLGIDMIEGEGVDVVFDLEWAIPTAWVHNFAHVDCVSVLEHVERPWLFAENIEFMLEPGGTILVTVPWIWRIHNYPSDYWRMTPAAIKALFPNIEWEPKATRYALDHALVRRIGSLTQEQQVWFPRSELLMFGVRR